MAAIASQKASRTVYRPGWAAEAAVIIAVGVAILVLREAGILAPDLTLPPRWDAPGAPDLTRQLV